MLRFPRSLLALLLCALIAALGCSDDDPPTRPAPPTPGTITIQHLPDTIDAPWSLTGPGEYEHDSSGYAELEDMVPGEYTLTWGEVPHTELPDPATSTQTLEEDGALTFTGVYIAEPGTVIVDPLIVGYTLHAPWQLAGPEGFSASGQGRVVYSDRPVGAYTVTWGAYGSGTQLPDPSQHGGILAPAGELTLAGLYTGLSLETTDGTLQLLREFYGNRTLEGYAALLSEDFLWIGQHGTDSIARDEEIAIASTMFSGEPGANDYRVLHISFSQLEPQTLWQDTPEDDPHFGAFTGSMHRNYLVDISFVIADLNLILRVQGPVTCYVIEEVGDDGPEFRFLGIVDATFGGPGKATESISWTQVKEIFR
jgi:hypothetical protein